MKETLIDFIRHGEPEGGRRYRGNAVDDALSEKGWQQMWGAVGDRPPWQQIISSPMRRCSAFAEAGEPCPIDTDKKVSEEEKDTKVSVEGTMACSAFAEAGEPCPIDTDKKKE